MSRLPRLAAALVVAALAVGIPAPAALAAVTAPTTPALPCPEDDGTPAGGQQAIDELGHDLPDAAAQVDATPAEFRRLLRTDATLRVDACGATTVVEPAFATSASAPAASLAASALAGDGDAFALSSRPGSTRTIFLDFDGQQLAGTMWNTEAGTPSLLAAPFDTDGAPGSFGPAESAIVRETWLRVAEDYAPFDVDVTTIDPGVDALDRTDETDTAYGARALITNDSIVFSAPGCGSSCGGRAVVGAFDRVGDHETYQPAMIFQQGLGGRYATAKVLAEAAAHEVGHNLGLRHDGTTGSGGTAYYAGQDAWAPIMGNSYARPMTQWSKGEYAGASNTEDDLAVIASHGLALLPDDVGDSAGTATSTAVDGPAVHAMIGTAGDTDWFSFTVPAGAAPVVASVQPQEVGADLDAALTVRDANGAVVARGATVTMSLGAGSYTAQVDGVGGPDNSDYASLGRYSFSVGYAAAATAATPAPVALVAAPTPVAVPPAAAAKAVPSPYAGSLPAAVAALRVAPERAAGASAVDVAPVDSDRDCRDTRAEKLQATSRGAVTWVTPKRCAVRTGRWRSAYDDLVVTSAAQLRITLTVPAAEAAQSGAAAWSAARRRAYANDLDDPRTLLPVSTRSARARHDREPTGWLPASSLRCTYTANWVAVKLRWGLSVDSAERARLAAVASSCRGTTVTVRRR